MTKVQEINLQGEWTFTPEGQETTKIQVPGGGWLKQGFICESGVYETRITMPEASSCRRVTRLELGAVNHITQYYIGKDAFSLQKIDEQVTAFTPQIVDLTDYVMPGESYLLQIHCRSHQDGRPVAPHWAEWSECVARGIFRDAYLRFYPEIYIADTFIKTYVKDRTVLYEVSVTNSSFSDQEISLLGSLSSWNRDSWSYPNLPTTDCTITKGETKRITVGPVKWGAGEESYWWPNVPYKEGYRAQLHNLNLEIRTNNVIVHETSERFGFREIKQVNDHFELNGVRVNFRGDNLQVANYDRIDYGGKGDAIDTFPGFLPPSATNPGWPKAVDNFQKLNYNVQREHMGPWTPYMIDTCDEMGLMLIGESASRWNGFDMENGRGFHEIKCLEDIIRRDKNHPSIVRWSSKNEAQCLDEAYHIELYDAIKAIDDTRPIFEDILVGNREEFNLDAIFHTLKEKDDFTWIEHYLSYKGDPASNQQLDNSQIYFTSIEYNDAVIPLEGRPWGIGEANWMRGSTTAGLARFSTMIALGRARGASDMRPYVLLASWFSSIPGAKSTDIVTEENRHPVYGEDNLPHPWKHPGIQLLQKSCHPLLALDYDFWWVNRKSDAWGNFPTIAPKLAASTKVTREITIFNDEFAGKELTLTWTIKEGSPSNRPIEKGQIVIDIEPGLLKKVNITFETPSCNTNIFLGLKVTKEGSHAFTDELTSYEIIGGEDFRSELFNGEERVFL